MTSMSCPVSTGDQARFYNDPDHMPIRIKCVTCTLLEGKYSPQLECSFSKKYHNWVLASSGTSS